MVLEITENSTVLIFVPEVTSRMEYVFEFMFGNILGINYEFTSQEKEFQESLLPKISYSGLHFSSGLFLKAHPILFEKDISKQEIEEVGYLGNNLFFPTSDDSVLPFDPFAFSFFVLTRYEEYLSETSDEHGRFTDSGNILVQLGLHQNPIVDQIAYWIAEKITEKSPSFAVRDRRFQIHTTIDIDNAWAYKNKSYLITIGAFLKALFTGQWNEVKQRLVVALGIQTDPYDTYSFILSTYQGLTDRLIFFFLMGDRNRFDKNVSHKNKAFRQVINNLASVCEVGIHPSYASNEKIWLFQKEKERLENIIKRPVTQSRQHYLKLRFPKTYNSLLKSGITDDYTMGFAGLEGFRAGTCTPFAFFDLTENLCTELTIHPFQVMDVTLKNYLHLNPEEAWALIEKLMQEVKKVNGTFVSLWHNESLKDSGQWAGWRMVFEKVCEKGLKLENE